VGEKEWKGGRAIKGGEGQGGRGRAME